MAMLVILLCSAFTLSSCGSDDDGDGGNGSGTNSSSNSAWGRGTWYAQQSEINGVSVKKSDFEEIEKAIDNHELLYTSHGLHKEYEHYAERGMFVKDDGRFTTTSSSGRLEMSIYECINPAVRIVDDNTLVLCEFRLYVDDEMKTEQVLKKLATLFNGHIFKSVSLYIRESYYTYTTLGNKIIVSNGYIYTISNGTLIQDGSSTPLVPFDPMKVFGITK